MSFLLSPRPFALAATACAAVTLFSSSPALADDSAATTSAAVPSVVAQVGGVETVASAIPHRTVRRQDPSHYRGTTRILQKGRVGRLERTYLVVRVAGSEANRTLLHSERTREPVTQVVAVGTKPKPKPKPRVRAASVRDDGLNWAGLAKCESGGDPHAVSSSGKYRGLYQFDLSTWRSVGGSGDPAQASSSEQTGRAQRLYARAGRSPWPVCGKYL